MFPVLSCRELEQVLVKRGEAPKYGKNGKKRIADLCREMRKHEAVVFLREDGVILRSTYTMRLELVGGPTMTPAFRIREYKRVYGDTAVERLRWWAVSGTRGRHESVLDALKREWGHETGLPFRALMNLEPLPATQLRDYERNARIESPHEIYVEDDSSVYPGVRSGAWIRGFKGQMNPYFFRKLYGHGEGEHAAYERGYTVHTKCFELEA